MINTNPLARTRYRGHRSFGAETVHNPQTDRYSVINPSAVAEYTENNHSKFFDASKFDASQAALKAANAPKPTVEDVVVEAARVARARQAELLGCSLKVLTAMARAVNLKGRSKLRNKGDLAHALAFGGH